MKIGGTILKRIGIYFFCVVAFGCVTSSILYRESEKLKEIRLEKQPLEEKLSESGQESAISEQPNREDEKIEQERILEVSSDPATKERFFVKEEYGYLVIYDRLSMKQYDETTIQIQDLPKELQNAVKEGLYFMNEEALYSFLESYSS